MPDGPSSRPAPAAARVRRQRHRIVLWYVAMVLAWQAIGAPALAVLAGEGRFAARLPGLQDMVFVLASSTLLLLLLRPSGGAPIQADAAMATPAADGPTRPRRPASSHEDLLDRLVSVLPDAAILLAGEQVLYANRFAARLFGGPVPSLLGRPLQALVGAEALAAVRSRLHDPLPASADDPVMSVPLRRVDGRRIHAGLAVGEVRQGGRRCHLLIMRDLDEAERTRTALEASNRDLQAMAGRLFSLQEDERRAISRDLHDDVGQAITAIKLSAWAALDEDDDARRRQDLQQIIDLSDSTVAKLRDLSTLLRPPQLDALGLEAALRWQAGVLFRSASAALQAHIDPLPRRPDNAIEQACFRIAQEGLTNALRHARASQVLLHLRDIGQGRLHLQVRDDGEGFDPAGPRGLGLIVMRERAQSVGGVLRIESAPGAGTLVDLHLPYQAGPCPAPTVET